LSFIRAGVKESGMIDENRLRRLKFRAWHRGTKEADLLVGGFFDVHSASWDEEQVAWYEALIDEEDVDIMAWAIGVLAVPEQYEGPMMDAMRKLDYVPIEK
jgi:antitoxin CptB